RTPPSATFFPYTTLFRSKLRVIIQASPLAIITLDMNGLVKMWNPAAERIFGWREAETVGRPLPFVPAEKQVEFEALRERVLRGRSEEHTSELQSPDHLVC